MSDLAQGTAPLATVRPLGDMPGEEFRRAGHALVDWIAAYLDEPRRLPVHTRAEPGDLRRALPPSGPDEGEPMEAILREFEAEVLPRLTLWNHPRFHAYFSISSSGPGILGELLTAALDINAMSWRSAPGATELEQVTLRWLLAWLGLPRQWFGLIVDSASTAALHAVVAARDRAEPESRDQGPSNRLVAYVSEQTHSSVEKAAITAGIGRERVRHIAVGPDFRMDTAALAAAVKADRQRGLSPFFVAATVGTTSTTAVDPVPEIADVCREHGLWLHVDGAYGAALGIVPECRRLLDGVDGADSLAVNAHKLLLVPLDCSVFYTRHPDVLRRAFALEAAYLKTDGRTGVDFMDYGLALGRRFRALKLWFVLRYFGREGLVRRLRRGLELASWLAERIEADPRFELAAPQRLGLVCFRRKGGDVPTRRLMEALDASPEFFLSPTVLDGRLAIRVAVGNVHTERQDLEALWSEIQRLADRTEDANGAEA